MHTEEMQVTEHLKTKLSVDRKRRIGFLPESIEPVHAVQPITGGIAPTIDPNQVLIICFLFIGV